MMHQKIRSAIALVAISALSLGVAVGSATISAGPAVAKSGNKSKACQKKDIVSTAKCDGSFTTLTGALNSAGLAKTLQGKGPFTVFAPSDAAFAKLPPSQKESLMSDKKLLPEVLRYHVVQGVFPASELAQLRSIKTVQGESLMLESKNDGDLLVVDGALVTKPDVKCSNGVIHVIDFLLVPERGK